MSDAAPQKKNNRIGLAVIAALIVFGFAVWGTAQVLELFWQPPTVAMCDGKPMGPYDKCGSYRPGGDTPQTTSDAKSQLESDRVGYTVSVYLTALVIVVVAAIAGGFLFGAYKGDRKNPSDRDKPQS